MISRRDFFAVTAALASEQCVCGQTPPVVVGIVVTDTRAHYINGLKASDFRIFEDDIPQKIATFSVGGKPDPQAPTNDELENSYTITYLPNPSNHNEGFRIIKVEIVPDVYKRWRVKARPGYRPEKRPTP